MQVKKQLAVIALSDSASQPNSYALVLEDMATNRRIPIIIGIAEAQAIAVVIEKIQPIRPLTHDLMKNILDILEAKLKEVLIHSLIDGVFHAVLTLEKADGSHVKMDARTSDAIALAVRFNTPIWAYEHVIESAGMLSDAFWKKNTYRSLAEYSLEELEAVLKEVIQKEDYESAVRIRELITKKKK